MSRMRKSALFAAVFLILIAAVPIAQAICETVRGEWPRALEIFSHVPSAERLRAYEETIESESFLARFARPRWQYTLAAAGCGLGAQAVSGEDGWLFYRPGVEAVIAGAPKDDAALEAIVSFQRQLTARGVRLLVLPTPDKASVYPDRLDGRVRLDDLPLPSPGCALMMRLREKGIETLDLFALFAQARRAGDEPLYLEQDTHWSPRGMELAADAVAARLISLGWTERGMVDYTRSICTASRTGDIVTMMQSPALEALFSRQEARCEQIREAAEKPFQAAAAAEITVLGDSFCRIYETDAPGAAGFAATLADRLRAPIAAVVNDGGAAAAVRQVFARRATLKNATRIVIWQFAERDLRLGAEDWKEIVL